MDNARTKYFNIERLSSGDMFALLDWIESDDDRDIENTVDSLARDQQICSRQRKFEIEKINVKIIIFTNKAREVNKGLLGMY